MEKKAETPRTRNREWGFFGTWCMPVTGSPRPPGTR